MALINCKKCGCQMSDKSEACPLCGMPVGMNADEYDKQLEAEQAASQQVNNETLMGPSEDDSSLNTPPTAPYQSEPQEPVKKSKIGLIIGIVAGVLIVAGAIGFFVKKSKDNALLMEEQKMTDVNSYPWLHGEWRNGVYGDILDIDSEGVKFIKNGLVPENSEEYEEYEDMRPMTIDSWATRLPDTEKNSFSLYYDKDADNSTMPQVSLQFNFIAETYPNVKEERAIIGIETSNQLLYYFDKNGKKIFLDKFSDYTFEEKWNIALEKANKQLLEDIANHCYDWLYGTWYLEEFGEYVVIDKDYIDDNGTKQEFNLHYELEDPYSEYLDYDIYLFAGRFMIHKEDQMLTWCDEYSFFEYKKISDSLNTSAKVYSNAYDGFVNIREMPNDDAAILGVLHNGPEGAVLLDTEGGWKKINCNGIVGYVFSKYVQDTPTEVFHGE